MHARTARPILLGLMLVGVMLVASAQTQILVPAASQRAADTTQPRASQIAPTTAVPTYGTTHRPAPRITAAPTLTASHYQPVSPTRTPPPAQAARPAQTIPPYAQVKDIYGYGQLLALSCESRSAADWARHFGVTIHELEFFHKLPRSENPEEGFVGDPNGGWGNIPPGPYGVHAVPIAKLLITYGLQARAVHHMPLQELRAEIAAGRPVIVWVTGHVEPGKGQAYQVAEGKTVIVARYEHTVIVTGYDEKQVTILDGKTVYKRPVETFLKSWSALENMAVVWDPNAAVPHCDPMGRC